eukprot:CAMPEP_0203924258 /NCGR_PEP_ID=MMETSP0359-20131031/64036_1 /ASSEMBLY_ACC=CAM_ASM_000338 /TAXON_ID=268821 /ORGANISM="Scrippsiella Hangoei, Strain SHTV-5" /LENGTH=172 /DNA_ID=CAMNT_0050852465 /DNA_START=399 /DNA_END=917 /DNA_ORIENTATION=-
MGSRELGERFVRATLFAWWRHAEQQRLLTHAGQVLGVARSNDDVFSPAQRSHLGRTHVEGRDIDTLAGEQARPIAVARPQLHDARAAGGGLEHAERICVRRGEGEPPRPAVSPGELPGQQRRPHLRVPDLQAARAARARHVAGRLDPARAQQLQQIAGALLPESASLVAARL